MAQYLVGSKAAWNMASLNDEDEVVTTVTVTGAALGDYVEVSSSADVADLELTGMVTAADVVTVQLSNLTSAGIDHGTVDIYCRVHSRTGFHQADV